MILEEVIILSRTVPEESKKYGRRVCLVAFCRDLNCLIRLYPVEIKTPCRAGDACRVRVVKNTDDNRDESFKLTDAVHGWLDTTGHCELSTIVPLLCKRYPEPGDTIDELNASRRSLGVIYGSPAGVFVRKGDKQVLDPQQMLMFEDIATFSDKQRCAPYLQFGTHQLQLREWGVHEWLRKHPDNPDVVWHNLRLNQPQLMIVGNMMNRRNVWMVLKTYRMHQMSLFV